MAVIASMFLAGCVDQAAPAAGDPRDPAAVSSESELGALSVLVVSTELAPLSNAVVEIVGTELRQRSDENGSAFFHDLEPKSYTVIAAKAGFEPVRPRGQVFDVSAGETTEAKIVLEQSVVVSATNAYHETMIFRGFISCSVEHISYSNLRNRSQCGNGVDVAGNRVGADPNDNFAHEWSVPTPNIMTMVLEAAWSPAFATLGEQLFIAAQDAFTCSASSCNYANTIAGTGGHSPLTLTIQEQPGEVISKALNRRDAGVFPKPVWSVVRTHCPSPCTVAVTLQQPYELVTSAFYGLPAPEGWSAKASG